MKNYSSFFTLALLAVALTSFRGIDVRKVPMPDLVITDIHLVCAAQRWLVFTVANIGDYKNKATQIRIRPTDGDDPTQRCIQQAVRNVPILQAGDDIKLRVPLKYSAGCDCLGPLTFELYVDHKFKVAESDETNNEESFSQE